MKITIYELLGLIKDDKAPKQIKYKDKIYYYFSNHCDLFKYETMSTEFQRSLSLMLNNMYLSLTDEVEIIEEEKLEKNEKIEKIEIDECQRIKAPSTDNFCYSISMPQKIIIQKLNEVIDKVNKMKEGKE